MKKDSAGADNGFSGRIRISEHGEYRNIVKKMAIAPSATD